MIELLLSRQSRRLLVPLLIGVWTCGCTRTPRPSPLEVLRFASTPQPLAAPALIAESRHLWPPAPRVEVTQFVSGRLILDSVLGGSADIGMAAETPLALAASQGRSFVILATITQTAHSVSILGRTDRGVTSPEALRGRTVAMYADTLSEYYMDQTLGDIGLKRSDLKQVFNLSPPDMVNAFVAGHVDAAFIWEPHVAIIRQQMGRGVTVFSGPEPSTGTYNLFTTRDFLNKHPASVLSILRSLISATQFIGTNRGESINVIAPQLGLTPKVVDTFFDEFTFKILLSDALINEMIRQAQWLSDRGQIHGPHDYAFFRRFIDPAPLQRLDPAAVALK